MQWIKLIYRKIPQKQLFSTVFRAELKTEAENFAKEYRLYENIKGGA